MAYRLPLDEPVADAVRRTAHERARHAAAQLRERAGKDPETAIHEARKDCKKLRSLLRLVREGMDAGARRRENAALRAVARSLSASRDVAAVLGTLDDLAERGAGQVPATTFGALREALAGRAATAGAEAGAIDAAAAALEQLDARIDAWPLAACDDDALVRGLERCHRRGRAALRAARAEPSDERLHEWRKRVKDLWYAQRLLRDAWPPVLAAEAAQTGELADLLGGDHDLAVLRELLAGEAGPGGAAAVDLEPVLALADRRRAELRARAWELGARVYAERPGAAARRHARYLRAARVELARGAAG